MGKDKKPQAKQKQEQNPDVPKEKELAREQVVPHWYSGGIITIFRRFSCYMYAPDDATSTALLRLLWGLVMALEIWHHIDNDYIKTRYSFYQSDFHFKFWLFEWVEPIPFAQMKVLLWALLFSAFSFAVGFMYRFTALFFLIGFTYLYLLEVAFYLNHFYALIIIQFLIVLYPANCILSVDAWLNPSIRSDSVPKWVVWSFKAFLFILYTYAGIVKINEDWLRGEPLRHWIGVRLDVLPVLQYEFMVYFFSYGGMIYDLIVGFLLLIPKTRWLAVLMSCFFHFTNKFMFNIGIFPYMCLVGTTFFFDSDWPRRLWFNLTNRSGSRYVSRFNSSFTKTKITPLSWAQWVFLFFLLFFILVQVLLPLRHRILYPKNNVFWDEHGHRYSWRMKLRDKSCDVEMFGYNPKAKKVFYVPIEKILFRRQYSKMTSRPELMAQFSRAVGSWTAVDGVRSQIYAFSDCHMNYRRPQPICNSSVNLADVDVWDWPYDWVLPMEPLTEQEKEDYPWRWPWYNPAWIYNKLTTSNLKKLAEWDKNRRSAKLKEDRIKEYSEQFYEFIKKEFNNSVSEVKQNIISLGS